MAPKKEPFSQVTLQSIKDRIYQASAEGVEQRLEDIAYYATSVSPVDTGAYVTSFSIVRAGQGGGRMRTSNNKPTGQDPQQKQQEALGQLYTDIGNLNLKQMLEDDRTKITLRNRSRHADNVENGTNWSTPGYAVFAKVRGRFK